MATVAFDEVLYYILQTELRFKRRRSDSFRTVVQAAQLGGYLRGPVGFLGRPNFGSGDFGVGSSRGTTTI